MTDSPGTQLGTADLHAHTTRSDGMASPIELVRWAEQQTMIDVLAVTDHEDLSGAWAAQEAAAQLGARLQVIAGMEITTLSGHLIALFLEEPVPSFRSLTYTLAAVHAQGGLCLVPHPLCLIPYSLGRRAIARHAHDSVGERLDAVELASGAPLARRTQARARGLNAARWRLPEYGGSDAHFPQALGSAVTRFPGHTANDLQAALRAGLTLAEQRQAPSLRRIGMRALARQQLRALCATPRNALRRPRRRSRNDRLAKPARTPE